MKGKLFFSGLILSFLALNFAKAQNIQFEDVAFKAALLSASPENWIARDTDGYPTSIDTNGDGEISQTEALNVYQLDINKTQDITSINGIEYFTNLIHLSCNALSMLKNLDLSKNINLQYLDLNRTGIQTLDVSRNINLEGLALGSTGIKTLDVSKNINLKYLGLNSTGIQTLNVSKNNDLEWLALGSTGIKTLDVSRNIKLTRLDLYGCVGLTSLYMKNGVKKYFTEKFYNFWGTNLNYICCNEDKVDEVEKYMQDLATRHALADGWQFSNLTITSDCEAGGTKEASNPNP